MTKKFSAELHFAQTDQELEADLRKFSHIESDQPAYFPLHLIKYKKKEYLCCIAGGFIGRSNREGSFLQIATDPETYISHMGYCTFSALAKSGSSAKTVIFKEIRKGPTPIRKKMIDAFRTAEKFESNRICFLLEIDSVEHKAILGLLDIKGIKHHGI